MLLTYLILTGYLFCVCVAFIAVDELLRFGRSEHAPPGVWQKVLFVQTRVLGSPTEGQLPRLVLLSVGLTTLSLAVAHEIEEGPSGLLEQGSYWTFKLCQQLFYQVTGLFRGFQIDRDLAFYGIHLIFDILAVWLTLGLLKRVPDSQTRQRQALGASAVIGVLCLAGMCVWINDLVFEHAFSTTVRDVYSATTTRVRNGIALTRLWSAGTVGLPLLMAAMVAGLLHRPPAWAASRLPVRDARRLQGLMLAGPLVIMPLVGLILGLQYLLYTRFGHVPSWLASLHEGVLIPSALIACVLLNLCGRWSALHEADGRISRRWLGIAAGVVLGPFLLAMLSL